MPSVFVSGCWRFDLSEYNACFFLTPAWRDWVQWCYFWLHTSCCSPGETPARCIWVFSTWHFILAWWIFKPRIFLHIFPHRHIEFDDCSNLCSLRYHLIIFVRDLMLPPSKDLLGVCNCSGFFSVDFSTSRVASPDMFSWSLLIVNCLSNLLTRLFLSSHLV